MKGSTRLGLPLFPSSTSRSPSPSTSAAAIDHVDVLPPGSLPDTRSVRSANMCRIAVHRPGGGDTLVVLSVIDNLVKGASGQAVQNMNIMFGLPETLGLEMVAVVP